MKEEWVRPNELYDLQVAGAPMHYEDVGGIRTLVSPVVTYSNLGKDLSLIHISEPTRPY